jgi:hypothetical protein
MNDEVVKRLLVCGGRNFSDEDSLALWMREAVAVLGVERPEDMLVIHGGARGADSVAGRIAAGSKVPVQVYPADWNQYGRRAGFLRNKQMLDEGRPDLVLAAPGGVGTAMMVKIALAAGVPVLDKRALLGTCAQNGHNT